LEFITAQSEQLRAEKEVADAPAGPGAKSRKTRKKKSQ
jgi:hypothetical protein